MTRACSPSIAASGLPFVSICLLTYKRAAILPRSLDTLLNQTHTNFELIINDDKSPDNTEEVCSRYEQRDSRVRYFRNDQNLRYAGNQNVALSRACSDYVAIVHDGDTYRSDLIEKWTRALVTYPSAAFVFNAVNVLDAAGQEVIKTHRHSYPPLLRGLDFFDAMIRSPSSPVFGIVMVRKSHVIDAGGFDTSLPVLGDVDMWFRLLLMHDAAYIAEPLLNVAQREYDHPNRRPNWEIHDEYERIYFAAAKRRYPNQPESYARLQRDIGFMLLKSRLLLLAWAVRHGNFKFLREAVAFMRSHPLFANA